MVSILTSYFLWAYPLAQVAFAIPTHLKRSAGPVKFEIDLTWETNALDGVPRQMILMNGQFPGPPLQLVQGDEVEFLVNNYLPFGTSVHFRGMTHSKKLWFLCLCRS